MSSTPATAASPAPLAPSPSKRFSEIDSLRAIACALVILAHSSEEAVVRSLGQLGVMIFFAISGFVIPSSLRGARWTGVRHFAIRRFWRLYPPFWVTLLLMYFGGEGGRSLFMWFSGATMVPEYFGSGFLSPHFWTLQVEVVFYIVLSVLFLLLGRLSGNILLITYLLCAIGLVLPWDIYQWLPIQHLIIMFWGSLCRKALYFDFSRRRWLTPIKRVDWSRSAVFGFLTVPLIYRSLVSISLGHQVRYELMLVCAALTFLFWIIFTPVRINWLSRIGHRTYSTYLLHFGVMILSHRIVKHLSLEEFFHLPLFFTTFVLVLSFAVGALAYRWIEQPSDAIGKQLAAGRAKCSRALPPPSVR